MQNITIVGLGLIGGSIGLGLRAWSETTKESGEAPLFVTGFDLDLEQQHYAQKIKAVDNTEWDLTKAVRNADIVIICTPVLAIKETFENIAPALKSGAVVADAGSTKTLVMSWAKELLPNTVSFIGTHPMAGKAMSIEGAEAGLFKGATWCVCPDPAASEESIRNVLGMITALEAEPYFIDPLEHDAYVAGISHLPFVLSASLVNAVSADPSWRDMRTLTASGFRDMSRLAGGSPDMHRDITLTNKDAIVRWIDSFSGQLNDLRNRITAEGDESTAQLTEFFNSARDARADWATRTTREGELLQGTTEELSREGFGGQMGRMLLGGFGRKARLPSERAPQKNQKPGPNGVSSNDRT
jgi:prephenate dehydrogenase